MNAKRGNVGERNKDSIGGMEVMSISGASLRLVASRDGCPWLVVESLMDVSEDEPSGIQSRTALYARCFSSRNDSIGSIQRRFPSFNASLSTKSRKDGSVITLRNMRQVADRLKSEESGMSCNIC